MTYGEGGFRRGGGFNRGPRRDFGPREMTKIKCSECGKEDEVPFKPREGTPVYCRACFMKKKGIAPSTPFSTRAADNSPKKTEEDAEMDEMDEDSDEDEEEFEEDSAQ